MKKFSAIFICLLMIITCGLAGCASFSIDKVKYYNEVLATVGEKNITRFQLLNAYNSYGQSYYVQQMGQSEEQALSSTLDLLIDRELLYQYALDNNSTYKPSAYQVNKKIEEMFDSVDKQTESYVEKAQNILNIEIDEPETEETTTDETSYTLDSYKHSPRARIDYEVKTKTVYYEDATYKKVSSTETEFSKEEKYNDYFIEYILEPEETTFDAVINPSYLTDFTNSAIVGEIKTEYFEHLRQDLNDKFNENGNKVFKIVENLFAKDLISYEYYLRDVNGKKYDTTNEGLFTRYFERTFNDNIQSLYLENVRTYYLEHEELSIELLTSSYSKLAKISYDTYSNNLSAYKTKMKDIGTKGDTVLYHPETDAQFGYFIHTLLSFDSIKENLELLKEEKDPTKYEENYNNFVGSLKLKPRSLESGLIEEETEAVSLENILKEYNDIINNYHDYDEKMEAFIKFMFKYTNDTATLSAGMPYVVGTNGNSAMEQAFTDEAVKLMKGQDGNMSTADITNLDGMCITSYGIHVLFYVGDVNKFDIPYSETLDVYAQTDDIANQEIFNLYTKTINPLTEKTYFDMMFDLVYPATSGEVYTSKNGYSAMEKEYVEQSKKVHNVEKFTTKISATKTKI